MDLPQHIVNPSKTFPSILHIHGPLIAGNQLGAFLEVRLLRIAHRSDLGKCLLDRFTEVFHPHDQFEQLCDGKVRKILAVGTSNLLYDVIGAHVGDAGTLKRFDVPMGGEAWRHLMLHDIDLRQEICRGFQHGGESNVGGILLLCQVGSLWEQ